MDSERGCGGRAVRNKSSRYPSMTAHGSKDYTGRLSLEVSGSDQVLDAGLSADGGIGCQVKTFVVVVAWSQILGSVARLEEVTSPCNVQKDSTVDTTKNQVELFPGRYWSNLYVG